MVFGFSGVRVCGLTGFGVVRWGGMEEEVDYTSDGVNERDIFVVGGFSGALGRQGALSGSLMTGRGPGVPTGLVEVVELAENDCAQSKIPGFYRLSNRWI